MTNTRPVVFWEQHKTEFPILSKVAQIILRVCTSSSALERTFSITSGHCTKDRNRIKAETLEKLLQAHTEDTFIACLKNVTEN